MAFSWPRKAKEAYAGDSRGMVRVTCPLNPKELNGKACGYTWDNDSQLLYIRCPSCRGYFLNPIHDTKKKEVKE
jgi:hypothetical protein